MKVFISHSSKDKWIARNISKEIEGIGFETFLDEKDIKTGEEIDKKLLENLRNSDHFLLLLTPESQKSEWVSMELGAAWGLGKQINIFYQHVPINEIPKAVDKKLARSLNEIEIYFQELRDLVKTPEPKAKRAPKKKTRTKTVPREAGDLEKTSRGVTFNIGDQIKLPTQKPLVIPIDIGWNREGEMDKYLGLNASIVKIDAEDNSAQIDIDGGEYWWSLDWLSKDKT